MLAPKHDFAGVSNVERHVPVAGKWQIVLDSSTSSKMLPLYAHVLEVRAHLTMSAIFCSTLLVMGLFEQASKEEEELAGIGLATSCSVEREMVTYTYLYTAEEGGEIF